jgi:hypothetical protein
MKIGGRNAGEVSERVKSIVIVKSGVIRSATVYQRAPTRHLSKLDSNSRKPAFPYMSPVKRMPATLGPRSGAIYMNSINSSEISFVPRIPPRPITMRMPTHEITNVKAKYVRRGCLFIKFIIVDMMFSFPVEYEAERKLPSHVTE